MSETVTPDWNAAITHAISHTWAVPAMTSQNVLRQKKVSGYQCSLLKTSAGLKRLIIFCLLSLQKSRGMTSLVNVCCICILALGTQVSTRG